MKCFQKHLNWQEGLILDRRIRPVTSLRGHYGLQLPLGLWNFLMRKPCGDTCGGGWYFCLKNVKGFIGEL